MKLLKDYSLLSYNTFGIDVRAARFLEYQSEEELQAFLLEEGLEASYLHIGQGSNLLFTKDFEGTVLHSCIRGVEVLEEDDRRVHVRVGAGTLWDDFVSCCVSRGWYGAENLSLIPGEVGASAVQNIGAYGVEVKDLIEAVETVDVHGIRRVYAGETCGYAYRDSIFKRPDMKQVFVTRVRFSLDKTPCYRLDYGSIRAELAKHPVIDLPTIRRVIVDIRQAKLPDPKVLGNAGSFFKNPVVPRRQFETLLQQYPGMPYYELDADRVKIPAGWLIEQCSWKGKALGRASVHLRQALVLVNLGGATGHEIVALAEAVVASVYDRFQIEIHPEVNII